MATFEIVPHPAVLLVQVGVFLAGTVVVKKLFVEPYMALRDKREALTIGNKDEATRALAESDAIATRLEQRLAALTLDMKQAREKSRDEALTRRDAVIAAAQVEARNEVAKVETLVAADLAAERTKIPSIINKLTEEVYALALA